MIPPPPRLPAPPSPFPPGARCAWRLRLAACLLAALASTRPATAQEWHSVQEHDASSVDVDAKSLAAAEPLRQVTVRERYRETQHNARGSAYDETRQRVEVHCADRQVALAEMSYFLAGVEQDRVVIPGKDRQFRRRFRAQNGHEFWTIACAGALAAQAQPADAAATTAANTTAAAAAGTPPGSAPGAASGTPAADRTPSAAAPAAAALPQSPPDARP